MHSWHIVIHNSLILAPPVVTGVETKIIDPGVLYGLSGDVALTFQHGLQPLFMPCGLDDGFSGRIFAESVRIKPADGTVAVLPERPTTAFLDGLRRSGTA
jgi:hypothetical protein